VKAVLIACALLLAATALSRNWAGDRLVHLGPMGAETCIPGVRLSGPPGPVECAAEPLATIRGDVELLRWSVLLLGFAAAVGLVLATWLGPRAPIVALVILAAVAIGAFELVMLSEYEHFSVARAFYLALAAAIAGIIALVVVAKRGNASA
jgi:hypothetical protein